MKANASAGEVQTVCGAVAPAALGFVLPHEHVLCDVTPPELKVPGAPEIEITPENAHEVRYNWIGHYGNHVLNDQELAAAEVARFAAVGGGAIVELTIEGIAPDPAGLRFVSERTGTHIVAGTGFYIESFAGTHIDNRSTEDLASKMVHDILHGFGTTGIRAGIIGEIGVSDPWRESEQRVMRAAVQAQLETGATINVHPGRDPSSPLAVSRFVRACGGDTSRLIISHLDRTLFSDDAVAELLEEGCIAEWDFFGIESSYYPFANIDLPSDGERLNRIKRLIGRGYGDRILISQDICTRSRLVRFGGHGYAHLPRDVVAMMRRKAFTEDEINQITKATPQRLLALQERKRIGA